MTSAGAQPFTPYVASGRRVGNFLNIAQSLLCAPRPGTPERLVCWIKHRLGDGPPGKGDCRTPVGHEQVTPSGRPPLWTRLVPVSCRERDDSYLQGTSGLVLTSVLRLILDHWTECPPRVWVGPDNYGLWVFLSLPWSQSSAPHSHVAGQIPSFSSAFPLFYGCSREVGFMGSSPNIDLASEAAPLLLCCHLNAVSNPGVLTFRG